MGELHHSNDNHITEINRMIPEEGLKCPYILSNIGLTWAYLCGPYWTGYGITFTMFLLKHSWFLSFVVKTI